MAQLRSVALLVAILAGACSSGDSGSAVSGGTAVTTTSTAGARGTTGAEVAGAPSVPEALQFSVAAVDGPQVVGADYAGQDVALWFWAPW